MINRDDIERLIEEHHEQAFQWALLQTRGEYELAKDSLQDSYVKVLENYSKFRQEASFKTWLFTIIRNTCIGNLRKKRRWSILDDNVVIEWKEPQPAGSLYQPQYWRKLFERLSMNQAMVLQLVFYHANTLQEVAGILQMRIGTARKHYERGKAKLRKTIDFKNLTDDE